MGPRRLARGVEDLGIFRVVGQPNVDIRVDRPKADRFGLNVADVQDAVETAVGVQPCGGCSAAPSASCVASAPGVSDASTDAAPPAGVAVASLDELVMWAACNMLVKRSAAPPKPPDAPTVAAPPAKTKAVAISASARPVRSFPIIEVCPVPSGD